MKKIHLLLLLIGFISAQEEDVPDWMLGKGLYDMCNSAIKNNENPESITSLSLQAGLECYATFRTFVNTIYTIENDIAVAEYVMQQEIAEEKEEEFEYRSAVVSLLKPMKSCDVFTSMQSIDFAYFITDYIKDNPEYRNKVFTMPIWMWAKEKCGISPFE